MSYCISPPSLQFGFFSSLLSNLLVLLASHQILIVLYNWYLLLYKCTLPFETDCKYWGDYLNCRLVAIELRPLNTVPFPVIPSKLLIHVMKGISHPLLQFDFFDSRLQFPIQSPVPLVGSFSLSQFPSEVHISSLDIAIKSFLKPPRLLLSAQMPFSIIVWFVPHGPDHAMCFIVPAVPMSYWAVAGQ